MATKTKTFKIGERAKGGVITVEITGKIIVVIGKEWDTSAGYSKGSNQSNAKEFTRGTAEANDTNAYRKVINFLEDLTTPYYAGKIMEWIESKVEIKEKHFWE
jgi:hypothetical protein